MEILLVEDDFIQSEYIRNELNENGELEITNFDVIETELEFRERFPEIAMNGVDIVIMDIMLRWAFPSRDPKRPPKDIEESGFYRAGIRCIKMLRDDQRTRDIPVIVYSILDEETLKVDLMDFKNVKYVYKDFLGKNLANAIRSLTLQ